MTLPVVTDIMVSNALMFRAPLGSTLPARTLAFNAAWPAGWDRVGFLKQALKTTYDYKVLEIMIEESLAPVDVRKTEEHIYLETVMADLRIPTLDTVWAASTDYSDPTVEVLTAGGNPEIPKFMYGFEGRYRNADGDELPLRLFIYRGATVAGGALEFTKMKDVGTPFKIGGFGDLSRAVNDQLFQLYRVLS
jgi:hypothetical protein